MRSIPIFTIGASTTALFYVVAVFTPFLIFGEGLRALLSSWLLSRVIRAVSYIPDGAEESAMDGGEV